MANLKPSDAVKVQDHSANIRRIPLSESSDGGQNWTDKAADFANLRLYSDLLPLVSNVLADYDSISGGEILISSICSDATLTNEGGAETGAGTGDFDSFAGYLPDTAAGGGITNIEYDLTAVSSDLEARGQIAFEIESEEITANNASVGSVGNTRGATETLLCSSANAGLGPTRVLITIQTSDINGVSADVNQGDNNTTFVTHSGLKGRYVKIVLTWDGVTQRCYVDGILQNVGTFTLASNQFNWLQAGASSILSAPIGNRIRNLVVSSKVADFPVITNSRIANTGHSYADQGYESWSGTGSAQGSFYDLTAMNVMQAGMRNTFSKELDIVQHALSGAHVLRSQNLTYESLISGVRADNPRLVIYNMGANDIILNAVIDPQTEFDLQQDMIDLLANPGGAERVFVCTAPTVKEWNTYDTADYLANTVAYNDWVYSLPAWWDGANPTDSGRIIIVDLFTAFGGEEPMANIFMGQVSGAHDNLHPSPWGQALIGRVVLDHMIPYL